MIIVNGWKPLTIITKRSILDVAAALNPPLKLPDDSPEEEEVSGSWKKRRRYAHKCKEAAWKRWVHEYLTALRQRHNLSHKKTSENQYRRCGHDKRRREELGKVEDRNYREFFHG